MAKNKGKKRGLLLGEIRIQRRVKKDGTLGTVVWSMDNNGDILGYYEMAGMLAVGERQLYEMYQDVEED